MSTEYGQQPPAVAEIREQVAKYAHQAWAGWMAYLFDQCVISKQGKYVIPDSSADRWMRQVQTDYDELPENEKDSDRAEADRMLAIAEPLIAADTAALLDALLAIRDLCVVSTRSSELLDNTIAIRSVAEQAIRAAEGGEE